MKALAVSLAFACLLSLPSVAPPQGRGTSKSTKVRQLKKNLSSIRNQKAKWQAELNKTRKEVKEVIGQMQRVDTKLVEVQTQLEDTTERLVVSKTEQHSVGLELEYATAKLAESNKRVRQRLKNIYMRGPSSSLSAFVGTKSVGEVASRGYLLQTIAKKDRKIFDEHRSLRARVADRKRRADELVVEVTNLADRQKTHQQSLRNVRAEKGQVLGSLNQKAGRLREMIRQFEEDERRIRSQIASFLRVKRSSGRPLPRFVGSFLRPVNAPVTSSFGMRMHPILKYRRLHAGVDFGAAAGTPIKAAASGEVIAATYLRGYGNTVIIHHGGEVSTVYAHASRLLVSKGQMVKQGQVIARVGSTGLSTSPHLHWEVHINGSPVNPMRR